MKLYPFQKTAVNCLKGILKKSPGAICRMDEGLGKTYVAAAIAQNYNKVLWVGPARSLKSVNEKYPLDHGDITFISYHGFADITKVKPSDYDIIIWDECQHLRNYSAQWTTRFVKTRGKMKHLFLSATPAVKHELDYSYIMRKCGAFSDFKSMADVYVYFFGAKPSRYGDFLEKSDLQNEEEFLYRLEQITYDITQEEADRDIPPVLYRCSNLDKEWVKAKSIEDETKARIRNGEEKIPETIKEIKEYIKLLNIRKSLILFVYHDNAKLFYEKISDQNSKIALNSKEVKERFDEMKTKDYHLVTTMGLTDCNLDLNECDHVFIVESTYSMPKDRQSIRRCLRVGKRSTLNVYYFPMKGERTLEKAISTSRLFELRVNDKMRIRPSQIAILEKCPGSYWVEGSKIDWVEPYAFFGTQAHKSVERYIENDDIKMPAIIPNNIRSCVNYCRKAKKIMNKYGIEDKVELKGTDMRGTVDFWAANDNELIVLDYKNGSTKVDPNDNLQLQSYALMICRTYNLSPKNIFLKIAQGGKINTCNLKGNRLQYIEERILKIIENVKRAEDNPLEYLNKGKCSFFCSAREIHEANKGEEEMSKKLPRFTVKGTCIYTNEEGGVFKVGVSLPKEDIPVARLKKAFSPTQLKLIGKGILDSTNEEYSSNKVMFIGNRKDYLNKGADFSVSTEDEVELDFTINIKEGDKPFAFFNLKDITVVKKAKKEETEEEEDHEALIEEDASEGEVNWL